MRRLVAAIALLAPLAAGAEPGLDKLLKRIAPSKQECRFEDVGWRPSLWHAVVDAHRVKKPILLWAMNGHPLACT